MGLFWNIFCFLSVQILNTFVPKPTIRTPLGDIKGTTLHDCDRNKVHAFYKIPYAKPPVGRNRFEPPVDVEPWHPHTLDGTKESQGCIQRDFFNRIVGSEDCLFLNIFTPSCCLANKDNSTAVMVFIHGGSFSSGDVRSFVYVPHYLVSKGFLSTGDSICPGNNGLRDMIASLTFLKKYISYWNGDPNRITIFGVSAGAAAVHMLMLSPLIKGLISGAISQSGSILNIPFFSTSEVREKAKYLARTLHCPTNSTRKLISCLKFKRDADILEASLKYYDWSIIHFPPRIDVESKQPVLPEEPLNLHLRAQYNNIPWITGTNTREGYYWSVTCKDVACLVSPTTVTVFKDNKEMKSIIEGGKKQFYRLCMLSMRGTYKKCKKIYKFYFHNSNNYTSKYRSLEKFIGDFLISSGVKYSQKLQSLYGLVYTYKFSCQGQFSLSFFFSDEQPKPGKSVYKILKHAKFESVDVGHADELLYLFGPLYLIFPLKETDAEMKCVHHITDLWTYFAKTGAPTNQTGQIYWPPYFVHNQTILNIGENLSLTNDCGWESTKQWIEFYDIPSDFRFYKTSSRIKGQNDSQSE